MTSAQRIGTPLPVGATVLPGTLRARMEEARSQGTAMTLKQAVGVIVPLAVEVAERHTAGDVLYLHRGASSPVGASCLSPELGSARRPSAEPGGAGAGGDRYAGGIAP
jgi:hypothetical protein